MKIYFVDIIRVGVEMSQHFKISKNGNIKGICPKTSKTIHNSVCKTCNDCLSFNAPLGIPTLIICRCGGVEGYTYSPQGEKTRTIKEKRR